jgi:hypothetical protein
VIKINNKDLEKLKKIIPEGHLIIATSNYTGFKNLLGFLAQYVVNIVQKYTGAFYDNLEKYIAHVFLIFYKNGQLFVGEMDKSNGWKVTQLKNSNTFLKLKKGEIRIFDLGEISEKEMKDFLEHAKKQKYSLIEAISSLKLFAFLNIFISRKTRFLSNNCHCGSVFFKYKPFYKYLKTTRKLFFNKYKTHHPEAIDHYLIMNFPLHVLKVLKNKINFINTKE